MATPISSGRICAHSLIDVRKNLAVLIFSTSEENGSRPRLSLTKILYGPSRMSFPKPNANSKQFAELPL